MVLMYIVCKGCKAYLKPFFALELLFYMQLFIAEILKDFPAHTCGKKMKKEKILTLS